MSVFLSKVLFDKRCVEVKWNILMKSGGTNKALKVIWIEGKERERRETVRKMRERRGCERKRGRERERREGGRERGRGEERREST